MKRLLSVILFLLFPVLLSAAVTLVSQPVVRCNADGSIHSVLIVVNIPAYGNIAVAVFDNEFTFVRNVQNDLTNANKLALKAYFKAKIATIKAQMDGFKAEQDTIAADSTIAQTQISLPVTDADIN